VYIFFPILYFILPSKAHVAMLGVGGVEKEHPFNKLRCTKIQSLTLFCISAVDY
jgi:hypothetical protein